MSDEQPKIIENPKAQFDSIMNTAKRDVAIAKGLDPDADDEGDLDAFEEEDDMEAEDEPATADEEESDLGPINLNDEEPDSLVGIDKNLGGKKIPLTQEMTIEQHQKNKVEENQQAAIQGLKNLKDAASKNLKPEELAKINLIVSKAAAGTLIHPVAKHLVGQKAKAMQRHQEAAKAIRQLQQDLLNKVAKASNELVEAQGVMKSLDKQLLDLAEEDPSLVE